MNMMLGTNPNAIMDEKIEDACRMFDKILDSDLVSWNAMIARYAQHDWSNKASEFFFQMQGTNVKPDQQG